MNRFNQDQSFEEIATDIFVHKKSLKKGLKKGFKKYLKKYAQWG